MQVRDIMTATPECCSPQSPLQAIASAMAEHDCGEIPVLDDERRPIGVVTDRDIACRAVAQGKDPKTTIAREVMSRPVVTVTPETSVEDCCESMEEHQIRRVPVVDSDGRCCGIVSQADIALHAREHEIAQVVKDISQPADGPSRV